MSPAQYAEAQLAKYLKFGEVYDMYVLKEVFIDGIRSSVEQFMKWYWSTHLGTALFVLARHKTWLQAITKEANVHSEKETNHRGNTKDHYGAEEVFQTRISSLKVEGVFYQQRLRR